MKRYKEKIINEKQTLKNIDKIIKHINWFKNNDVERLIELSKKEKYNLIVECPISVDKIKIKHKKDIDNKNIEKLKASLEMAKFNELSKKEYENLQSSVLSNNNFIFDFNKINVQFTSCYIENRGNNLTVILINNKNYNKHHCELYFKNKNYMLNYRNNDFGNGIYESYYFNLINSLMLDNCANSIIFSKYDLGNVNACINSLIKFLNLSDRLDNIQKINNKTTTLDILSELTKKKNSDDIILLFHILFAIRFLEVKEDIYFNEYSEQIKEHKLGVYKNALFTKREYTRTYTTDNFGPNLEIFNDSRIEHFLDCCWLFQYIEDDRIKEKCLHLLKCIKSIIDIDINILKEQSHWYVNYRNIFNRVDEVK